MSKTFSPLVIKNIQFAKPWKGGKLGERLDKFLFFRTDCYFMHFFNLLIKSFLVAPPTLSLQSFIVCIEISRVLFLQNFHVLILFFSLNFSFNVINFRKHWESPTLGSDWKIWSNFHPSCQSSDKYGLWVRPSLVL